MTRAQKFQAQIQQLNEELKYEYSKNEAPSAQAGTAYVSGRIAGQRRDPIDDVFTFHDNPEAVPHYIEIREAAKTFARVIDRHVPWCEDKRNALNHVRGAVMWANAGVALDGPRIVNDYGQPD